jgi:hypothetical protein
MYVTSSRTCSAESELLYAGIFPFPSAITAASTSSDSFCTSSERRSRAFSDLPTGVLPLPSAPWHCAQAFCLYNAAPSPKAGIVKSNGSRSMKLKRLAVIGLLIVACAAPETPAPSAPAPSTAEAPLPPTSSSPPRQPEQPAAPAAPVANITIENVQVANPLTVTGRARTFENNVVLRARAADGSLITETFTTATGEMGQHSPYRATLWLTRDPGRRVIVEALEYSAKDGAEQSLVRVERPFNVETVEARLFLPDKDCTAVHPTTRRIPKSISMARLLVEALIADRATPFPKGSRVESINLRDGTLTVDFNERLRNVGGSCAAQMIRASVTETLRALPSVKKVVITAAGSEALALQP